jgi:hypothetical protein
VNRERVRELTHRKIADSLRWLRVGQAWMHRIADHEGAATSSSA